MNEAIKIYEQNKKETEIVDISECIKPFKLLDRNNFQLQNLPLYDNEKLNQENKENFTFNLDKNYINLVLKENKIPSKIMMIGEGIHNYVLSEGKLIDANGVSSTLEELKEKMDYESEEGIDETVSECGLMNKPYDDDVKYYKNKILVYTKQELKTKLKKSSKIEYKFPSL